MKKETGNKAAILAACKYYKGEGECPFSDSREIFWDIERRFCHNIFEEDYYSGLFDSAKEYTESILQKKRRSALQKRFLLKSMPEKALAILVEQYLQKWMPYECDKILQGY